MSYNYPVDQVQGGRGSPSHSYSQRSPVPSRTSPNDHRAACNSNSFVHQPVTSVHTRTLQGGIHAYGHSSNHAQPSNKAFGTSRQAASPSTMTDRFLPPLPVDRSTRSPNTYGQQTRRGGLWSFVRHLPQPADDQTIVTHVEQVFALADQYVDNFYEDRSRQSIGDHHKFQAMHFPYLPERNAAADVLFLIAHPTIAIKHCLVYLLLSSIEFDVKEFFPSLLPPEFTVLESALTKSTLKDEVPDQFAALSAYRVLLAYLREGIDRDENYQAHLRSAMGELSEIIETTFSPWEQKIYAQDNRQPALENLLERTAQLGVLLFSQPCTFQFAWQVKPNATTDFEIAISPRLLKINDEEANELERSQLMINIKTCRSSFVEDLVDSDLNFRDLASYGSHPSHSGQAQHSVQSSVIKQMERHQTLPVDGVYRDSGEYIAETSDRGRRTAREAQIPPHVHELDSGSPGRLGITRCSEVLTPSAQDRALPQLPPLHNHTPLNMFSELPATPQEFSNSSARLPAVQGHTYGHQSVPYKDAADVTQHVVPHSISGPITTHEAFLHTKETRRKAAPCPPSSIQQFSTTQLSMGKMSSSRRRRSISASSDHRGRTSDTDLNIQPRRASFSNDRNATAHHILRQPDTPELQQPSSRLDVHQSAPVNAERGRPIGNAHSIQSNGPGHEDNASELYENHRTPSHTAVLQHKMVERNLRGYEDGHTKRHLRSRLAKVIKHLS